MRNYLRFGALGAALLLPAGAAQADFSDDQLHVVVLTDMSTGYSDTSGQGSVAAAELAIEDFREEHPDIDVRLSTIDHQNKADVGALAAREMIETGGADMFVDISNSAVSLAVQNIGRETDTAVLHVGSASADLYGSACSPTGALWLYDTYALAHGLGSAIVAEGGDTWYFISADYAFGAAMQASMTEVLEAAGGQVLGSVAHPVNGTDFSSFILQAQGSGAKIIGLANAAGDTVNAIKQANEFGVVQGGQNLAALIFYINGAKAVGAEQAQGLQFMTGYYWDRNDESRAYAERFAQKKPNSVPSQAQAGVYSATLAYLRAAAAADTDGGQAVLEQMKTTPIDDFFAEGAMLREDGRLMKDMFLVEVKAPDAVTGEWDLLEVLRRMPADEIIRPISEGGCDFVQ